MSFGLDGAKVGIIFYTRKFLVKFFISFRVFLCFSPNYAYFCTENYKKTHPFMAELLIFGGILLFLVGAAGRRERRGHERDWAAEGRTKMRIGDREYWVTK